jgi:hypothetical protein
MKRKEYIVKINDDIQRDRFYDSIKTNQVKDFYESMGIGCDTYAYLINQCSLFVRDNSDRLNIADLRTEIFHETSLEKIIETKDLIEKKSGLKLEEEN